MEGRGRVGVDLTLVLTAVGDATMSSAGVRGGGVGRRVAFSVDGVGVFFLDTSSSDRGDVFVLVGS
jgi:hypothetical protein